MMSPKGNVHLLQGRRDIVRSERDNLVLVEEVADCAASVCRDTPLLVIPRRGTADNDATCEDPALSAHDVESWAHHAYTAGGFGDVATAAWPTSYEMAQAADAHRARALDAIVAAAGRMIRTIARRVVAWHQQRQQAKAVYDALRTLDNRILRDIGIVRSEIAAVAREATVADVSSRTLTFWTSQGPPK